METPRWRLVLIEWVDSYGCSPDWRELSEYTPDVMVCRSVGWLLHDADDVKVVVPHIYEPHAGSRMAAQGTGDMTIPVSAILRMSDVQVREDTTAPARRRLPR